MLQYKIVMLVTNEYSCCPEFYIFLYNGLEQDNCSYTPYFLVLQKFLHNLDSFQVIQLFAHAMNLTLKLVHSL